MAWPSDARATQPLPSNRLGPKKGDPPGGTTGRVGCSTGVDEAPVPDAGSTMRAFSNEAAL
jgi:hypothetical protein